MANRRGKLETLTDFIFLGSKITEDSDYSHENKTYLLTGRKVMTNLDCILKMQRYYFASKCLYGQSYGFSSSHVRMWEINHKEGWVPKNWCFQIVMLEKTIESLLDSEEVKLVNLKGNQPWIFFGRTDAEALVFWPPDIKNPLIGKDPDPQKDWEQKAKGMAEDEIVT